MQREEKKEEVESKPIVNKNCRIESKSLRDALEPFRAVKLLQLPVPEKSKRKKNLQHPKVRMLLLADPQRSVDEVLSRAS